MKTQLGHPVPQPSCCEQDCPRVHEQEERIQTLTQALGEADETRIRQAQSEKLATVGLLARALAHGINNPLMVVLGRLDLLLEETLSPANQRGLVAIRDEAGRIADIMQSLRLFSYESTAEDWQTLHLHKLLDEAMQSLHPELTQRQIPVRCEWHAVTDRVQGQAIPLGQALKGLLRRLLQEGPEQGLLWLRTTQRQKWIEVCLRRGPEKPLETDDQQLFDPVFTDLAEGKVTGLTLAGAAAIINAHGGYSTVFNTSGGGLEIHVHLPILVLSPSPKGPKPRAVSGKTEQVQEE